MGISGILQVTSQIIKYNDEYYLYQRQQSYNNNVRMIGINDRIPAIDLFTGNNTDLYYSFSHYKKIKIDDLLNFLNSEKLDESLCEKEIYTFSNRYTEVINIGIY